MTPEPLSVETLHDKYDALQNDEELPDKFQPENTIPQLETEFSDLESKYGRRHADTIATSTRLSHARHFKELLHHDRENIKISDFVMYLYLCTPAELTDDAKAII